MNSETVDIAGVDVELYRITGHPVTDLVILKNGLTPIDITRLQAVVGGTLKGRNDTTLPTGETVTGIFLNMLQAKIVDINKWGNEYFTHVLVSLSDVVAAMTSADPTVPEDVVGALNALTSKIAVLDVGALNALTSKITVLEAKIGDIHTVATGING